MTVLFYMKKKEIRCARDVVILCSGLNSAHEVLSSCVALFKVAREHICLKGTYKLTSTIAI